MRTLEFSDVTVYPEYEVNIELNLEKNDINDWTLIFSFVHVRKKVEGFRIPAVFLHHKSTKLHVCTALDGNWNFNWNSNDMPVNKWFKLTIKQSEFRPVNGPKAKSKYIYEILIDGELMFQAINKNPKTYKNTNGYIGNIVDHGWVEYLTICFSLINRNFEISNFTFELQFPVWKHVQPTNQL